MIFRKHDPQAVFQRELLDGDLHILNSGGMARGGCLRRRTW